MGPSLSDGIQQRQRRGVILNDNTLNLPVVAQHHLDPNYAPHTAARRAAGV